MALPDYCLSWVMSCILHCTVHCMYVDSSELLCFNTTVRNTTVRNITVRNTTVRNTTVRNITVRNTTVRNAVCTCSHFYEDTTRLVYWCQGGIWVFYKC